MVNPVTLCGLLACPRVEYQGWKTAFYQVELVDIDPRVAAEFVEQQVDQEGLAVGETDTDFLLATMHHGHDVERAGGVDWADQEVNSAEEMVLWPVAGTWTVCGMFADDGWCYSGLWVAHGPRMAYLAAWEHYRARRKELLVAGVHPGAVGRAEESPTWADPVCTSQAEMVLRLGELIPRR